MGGWWDRFPGRLEHELEAFEERGLRFERDKGVFREQGRLLLHGEIEHDGEWVRLEVLYPDLFPNFRPEVFAPDLKLSRHQTPEVRNLCLLDRATHAWKPQDTGAWLVAERVPLLLSLFHDEKQSMRAAEVAQGEPITAYVQPAPGCVALVPAEALALDPSVRAGSGHLRYAPDAVASVYLRVLVCELVARGERPRQTRLLARADDRLAGYFTGQRLQMRWVRLAEPPERLDPDVVRKAAEDVEPGFGNPPWQRVSDGEVSITAVVFPEEVRHCEYEDAWLFAVRVRQSTGVQRREGAYLLRGERLTEQDLGARIPKLAPMRQATIAQVGVGALGAPLALELTRNQSGTLRLLEHDLVEAAQIVRWPLGLPVIGRLKLEALARFIEQHYPFTKIERFLHRLGQTGVARQARGENEIDLLSRLLDGATLVIDASAEVAVQQVVGEFARTRGLNQLYLSATQGAWGGQVVLIIPGGGGCWHCWKAHAFDGTIPLPPSEPGATVQPRGCASPTFTGASFDLMPIVAQAARVAAAAVSPEHELSSTLWVCVLGSDLLAAPSWSAHPIEVHPQCPYCTGGENEGA